MSLPQFIEGCPQHETLVRHKQRHRSRTVSKTSESTQPLTCCLIKRTPNFSPSTQQIQQIQDLTGEGVQRCLGGVQGFQGGSRGGQRFWAKNTKKPEKRSGTVWLFGGGWQGMLQAWLLGPWWEPHLSFSSTCIQLTCFFLVIFD